MTIDGQSESGVELMQSGGLTIYASADIHSPHYLFLFRNSIKKLSEPPCVFIFAGDIVDRGKIEMAEPVFNSVRERFPDISIISVFGNEEYMDREELFIRRYTYVRWLNDEIEYFRCGNVRLSVVGTRGSLKKPTSWQKRNIPGIEEIYRNRVNKIRELLERAKENSDIVILVSHYAVTKKTIMGEPPAVHDQLYDPRMENVIKKVQPDIAIHGHAHRGKPMAHLGRTVIYNVAFPLLRDIARIPISRGLLEFL